MVSVIIPAYNRQSFIELCVNSALGQSVGDIEVIIVDDGSVDCTGLLCDMMAGRDGRIRVVHQSNGGVSSARQAGIDIAKGEWICFLDSDDKLPERAIESYSKCFKDEPDIIVSGCGKALDPESFVLGISNGSICPALWGKLFRTDFVKLNMPHLPRELVMGEDMIANLVLGINAESVCSIESLQYDVNLNNNQSVMNTFRHSFQYENFFFKVFDELVLSRCDDYSYFNELARNTYILKLNGYRNVVLDGDIIDTDSSEWKSFFVQVKKDRASLRFCDRLFLRMNNSQRLFRLIVNTYLKIRK